MSSIDKLENIFNLLTIDENKYESKIEKNNKNTKMD